MWSNYHFISFLWLFYITLYRPSNAQQLPFIDSNWVWLKGASTMDQVGTYGTRGVESTANTPSARQDPSITYNSVTNSLIMFGGYTSGNTINDLWSYNLTSNNWMWISGSQYIGETATYGTRGVEAVGNVPSCRLGHSAVFDPVSNSLFLFGGLGYGAVSSSKLRNDGDLSDLWRYRFATGRWTWTSGSNNLNVVSTYGTQFVEHPNNTPGGRYSTGMVFHSRTYSLYLYGGFGYASTATEGRLADLWRFNITSGNWAVLSSHTTIGISPVHNTLRVESATTHPGSRSRTSLAINDIDDTLWLFGGGDTALMNDLFRFNINSQRWTWMSGSNTGNSVGFYGALHQENSNNAPMARTTSSMEFHVPSYNLIIYGGLNGGLLWDTWRFNLTSLQWALVFGSNAIDRPPSYGSRLVPARTNSPGGRHTHASCLSTLNGALYVFGGRNLSTYSTQDRLNDLWTYDIGLSVVSMAIASTTTSRTSTSSTSTSSTSSSTTSSTSTIATASVFASSTSVIAISSTSIVVNASTVLSQTGSLVILGDGGLSGSTIPSSDLVSTLGETVSLTTGLESLTQTPTDAPLSPSIDFSLIFYASAGSAGGLVLIAVVLAVVLIRKRSSAKQVKKMVPPQGIDSFQYNATLAQMDVPPMQQTMRPYGGYPLDMNNLTTLNTNMSMMTQQQSLHGMSPAMSTLGRQNGYSQMMPQQAMGMTSSAFLMNPSMGSGSMSPTMGMNAYNGGMSYQAPLVNVGQEGGIYTFGDNDNNPQGNYNQFQY